MRTITTTERWTRVRAAAAPRYLYSYVVSGGGSFPIDMLRYDSAWPATGNDAARVDECLRRHRCVELRSFNEPTVERWASFGWSVTARELGNSEPTQTVD